MPEVAVSTTNDLKCWCTFKASSMEELACHKQTHHTALSVSVGTTRCPKCRRRCKSSTDLQVHMQCCHSTSNDTTIHNSLEKLSNCSELRVTSYRGEYAFPAQTDWDINLSGVNSSGSSVWCFTEIIIFTYRVHMNNMNTRTRTNNNNNNINNINNNRGKIAIRESTDLTIFLIRVNYILKYVNCKHPVRPLE